MAFTIKFLSLQKPELEYEVGIRGDTPGATVVELRKQIAKLGPLFPSEDILESYLSVSADLKGVNDVLAKIQNNLDSRPDRNVYLRTQNLLSHLYHRLNRITCDDTTKPLFEACLKEFQSLLAKLNSFKEASVETVLPPSNVEPVANTSPVQVNVTCDRGSSNELCKIKFDGKSCVRSFIQRVTELCEARSISDSKILSYATEIFVGDALHWYRNIKTEISSWNELADLLTRDFSISDYDYRLISEIRLRSQGESENITVYLSIMSGLFSRLTKKLTEDQKLDILLHNIRPCYASTLASAPAITDISSLASLCRNYETVQARLVDFREPPRKTADTLAPEFAYAGTSSNKNNNSNKNFNACGYNNNNSKFNQYNPNYNKKSYSNDKSYTNTNNYNYTKTNYNNRKHVYAIAEPPAKPLYCPRCRTNTHNLRQCRANKREVYCFECGRKGVKRPECPNCGQYQPPTSKN